MVTETLVSPAPLDWFDGPHGQPIAHRFLPGAEPALVFLPGYASDMSGTKAQALLAWAAEQGRACLLLDYSGCGQSGGQFAEGTLSRWADEVAALVRARGIGRAVLVGSSMGGWLMLLLARMLGDSVCALVGIAPAPDFTDWGFSAAQKETLAAGGTVLEDNPYGPEPTPTHPGFWADGEANRQLEDDHPFAGPVRLLHGQRDRDVPWEITLRLAATVRSDDVQVLLIKGGDHRLSRACDIAALLRTVQDLPLPA